MISDSPYGSGDLLLSPLVGSLAGAIGAALMLGIVELLRPLSGIGVAAVLSPFGLVSSDGVGRVASGLLIYLMGGSVFGLLYALCEQNNPRRAIIGVGVFYGFLLWVLDGGVVGAFLNESARTAMRSLPFFLASLAYGFWLALVALWASRRRPAAAVEPRD